MAKKISSNILAIVVTMAVLLSGGCKPKADEGEAAPDGQAATTSPFSDEEDAVTETDAGLALEPTETLGPPLFQDADAPDAGTADWLQTPATEDEAIPYGDPDPRDDDLSETLSETLPETLSETLGTPSLETAPATPPNTYSPPASSLIFEEAARVGEASRTGTGNRGNRYTFIHGNTPDDPENESARDKGSSQDDIGYIALIEDIKVPAQEAGVLVEMKIREGDSVKLGEVLAKIDDDQAKMGVEVSQSKYEAASRKASNDVNIRYAEAAKNVAYAEIQQADEANKKVPGTVTQAEYRRLLLAHKQAELQIEQATHDYVVANHEVDVQRTELKAAQLGLERRVIKAPSSGIVLERFCLEGEWIKPGDPLLQLARLDVVRLKFRLDAQTTPMAGVKGRNVEVRAPLLPGKIFQGKVTFVDPVMIGGNKYQVWVEIRNEQENGEWLLKPLMRARAKLK